MTERFESISLDRMPKALVMMVCAAAKIAQASRCRLYLVGGFVRDFLLNNESWDLDFAVTADPILFGKEVAKKLRARFVPLHFDPPTGRIVRWDKEAPEATADFTELRGDRKSVV